MPPGKTDLVLYQGDDFFLTASFTTGGTAVDLTGHVFRAHIRTAPADTAPDPPVAVIACTVLAPATDGKLELYMGPDVTETLPTTALVWDLEGTDTEDRVTTYLAGKVTVTAEVTR